MYNFILGRQLHGTMEKGVSHGTFPQTAMRTYAGWGSVAYHRFPKPNVIGPWSPVISGELDRIAGYHRFLAYFRIRDLDDVKKSIDTTKGAFMAVPITKRWRTAPNGLIPMPTNEGIVEHHAFLGIKYDDEKRLITFMNNWGKGWGDGGNGYLPYDYFNEYQYDCWMPYPARGVNCFPRDWKDNEFGTRMIQIRNHLGNPCVVIDMWKRADRVRIGWCFMTIRDNCLDIEDLFMHPDFQTDAFEHRLFFNLSAVVAMGQAHGQRLRFWIGHADTLHRSTNFGFVNRFLRTSKLTVKKSPYRWAAYLAE
jgi:hypothetical protein